MIHAIAFQLKGDPSSDSSSLLDTHTSIVAKLLKTLHNSFIGVKPKSILKNSKLQDSEPIKLFVGELSESKSFPEYVIPGADSGSRSRPNQASGVLTSSNVNV